MSADSEPRRSERVMTLANGLMDDNPSLRFGQALFISIHTLLRDFANGIRGSRLDTFYLSDVETFLVWPELEARLNLATMPPAPLRDPLSRFLAALCRVVTKRG